MKTALTRRIKPENQPNESALRAHPRRVILRSAAAMATASSLTFLAFPSAAQAGNTISIVQLVNQESGKCLQPVNGSDGAAIVQETCNGGVAQQWTETMGTKNAEFEDRSTGLCIDAFGPAADGTSIVQWTCADPTISNQRWYFLTKNDSSGQYGQLQSGIDGSSQYGYCIATPGLQNGDAMLLYACSADFDSDTSELWSKPSP